MAEPEQFSPLDAEAAARMIPVGGKPETHRTATASGRLTMNPATLHMIRERKAAKGDVLQVARLAGIMAAKRTGDIIPLCHPLPITGTTVDFTFADDQTLEILATVEFFGRTGVEMEALTAVSAAALTVYDMVKSVDRGVVIGPIRLERKHGGRSGDWTASGSPA